MANNEDDYESLKKVAQEFLKFIGGWTNAHQYKPIGKHKCGSESGACGRIVPTVGRQNGYYGASTAIKSICNIPEKLISVHQDDYISKNGKIYQYNVTNHTYEPDNTYFGMDGMKDVIIMFLYDLLSDDEIDNLCVVSSTWRRIRNLKCDRVAKASIDDELYVEFKWVNF
ncbi:hypothetical protein HDV04_003927 [Boothiomyces sp. JEL0838]|nr:hypothetical protein HDV04_003927 [Boothiomyces sp. JEL0838]